MLKLFRKVFWGAYRGEHHLDRAELICIHSRKDNWGRGYGSMMMDLTS